MYLLTYASGYHEYFAINKDIDKAAHEIIDRFNMNCYHELHTIEELAESGESIHVYDIKNGIAFDDEFSGLQDPDFDYLETIRNAEIIEGSAFIFYLIPEKGRIKVLSENTYYFFDTRKEAVEWIKSFD